MPQFYVVAREIQYYLCEVEADNEEQAKELANELDAHDFDYLDGGDWEIVNVEKIHEKPKQMSLLEG